MSRLAASIRALAEDYSAAFGVSLGGLVRDALLGSLACLVLFIDSVLLIAGAGR